MVRSISVVEYQILWLFRNIRRRVGRGNLDFSVYAGKKIIDLQTANDIIRSKILGKVPFVAARFGSTELSATWIFDFPFKYSERKKQSVLIHMKLYSGFFPENEKYLEHFSSIMKEACKQVDLFGVWFNPMEDYMIKNYGSQSEISHLRSLEPWYANVPWTMALENKRVLIIHPFSETIRKQYNNRREVLFEKKSILPEFKQLYTLKAVQTIGKNVDDRFGSWFEALEWMYREAMKVDFDVAIIGCGAYGFPLATKIKMAGKQAIHMGGATQLLFGIKGRRWDTHPIISKLYNEYWVRPDKKDKPEGADCVESGCYW